jgi:hypothetical protein
MISHGGDTLRFVQITDSHIGFDNRRIPMSPDDDGGSYLQRFGKGTRGLPACPDIPHGASMLLDTSPPTSLLE